MKYIFVTGGVVSGLGKGICARLETLTAGKYWPYPTFYDLLFSV